LAIEKEDKDKEVVYHTKVWMWLINFIDGLSKYSTQIVLIIIGLLGTLWSLNFVMFIYFVVFAVHYAVLHLNYIRIRRLKGASKYSFQERKEIIEQETKEQKVITIKQRRFTLRFVLGIAVMSLIFTQLFVLIQVYKRYSYLLSLVLLILILITMSSAFIVLKSLKYLAIIWEW